MGRTKAPHTAPTQKTTAPSNGAAAHEKAPKAPRRPRAKKSNPRNKKTAANQSNVTEGEETTTTQLLIDASAVVPSAASTSATGQQSGKTHRSLPPLQPIIDPYNALPVDPTGRSWQPRSITTQAPMAATSITDSALARSQSENAQLKEALARSRIAEQNEATARAAAESRAIQLENRIREQRALEIANKYTPIPRPKIPKGSTFTTARLEEILGLPHVKAKDPVGKTRGVIYNWAQHVSRWVLSWAHRNLEVDHGVLFKTLNDDTQKSPMMSKVGEVAMWDFIGGPRFVNNWPMKEMLIRTMKNERDGLYRPITYRKRINKLYSEAKTQARATQESNPAYKMAALIVKSVIRHDAAGRPANGNIWEEDHHSVQGAESDEDGDEGDSPPADGRPTGSEHASHSMDEGELAVTLASAMEERTTAGMTYDWDDDITHDNGETGALRLPAQADNGRGEKTTSYGLHNEDENPDDDDLSQLSEGAEDGKRSSVEAGVPNNLTLSVEERAAMKARFGSEESLDGGHDDQDLIKGALMYRDNLLQRFAGDRLHAVGNEAALLDWDKTIRAYSTTWKNNMGINKEEAQALVKGARLTVSEDSTEEASGKVTEEVLAQTKEAFLMYIEKWESPSPNIWA
ncbi:hypothetical protein QFC20_004460 [Naganishia adeliensis]|uniref:Uncharacterized protein n=1 Tax=Naganishia adeliensis TaxID=92952 RepID=A0ACC2VZY7_9TREE|nr:hypothetical protein QFC20_004460 [Naganishia adeliensis]